MDQWNGGIPMMPATTRSPGRLVTCSLLLASLLAGPGVCQQPGARILPADFVDRVLAHVDHLAGLGHRQAGTANDRSTVAYLRDQFARLDVDVAIEPFEFVAFEFTQATFAAGGERFDVAGLGLDPYGSPQRAFEGEFVLIDHDDDGRRRDRSETEGRILVAVDPGRHFRLLRYGPALIVYVGPSVHAELAAREERACRLEVEGGLVTYESANVVGTMGADRDPQRKYIITAHHDTYGSDNPGASDNASGVGVMLELARFFKQREGDLDGCLRFVAFGAEEIGLVGSRAYVDAHARELERCELMFNIDNVGGEGPPYLLTTGGVEGIPASKGVTRIPARLTGRSWEGIRTSWRLLIDREVRDILSAVNHPPWLVDVVETSVGSLGSEVRHAQTQGSDALVFAQAGIVSSGVGIRSGRSHTSQDRPEHLDRSSLRTAGEIAARVVMNAMQKSRE
jgi:hypothetical protein